MELLLVTSSHELSVHFRSTTWRRQEKTETRCVFPARKSRTTGWNDGDGPNSDCSAVCLSEQRRQKTRRVSEWQASNRYPCSCPQWRHYIWFLLLRPRWDAAAVAAFLTAVRRNSMHPPPSPLCSRIDWIALICRARCNPDSPPQELGQ